MAMPFRRFLIYWFPVILYCLFIFIQSSFPSPVKTQGIPLGDKILHLLGYALLAALFFRALNATRSTAALGSLWVLSVLFTALYGAMDEVHQAFVSTRSADLLDFLADTGGAMIGAGVAAWLTPRMVGLFQKNHRLTNLRSSYK
jgi:VanZ family protein